MPSFLLLQQLSRPLFWIDALLLGPNVLHRMCTTTVSNRPMLYYRMPAEEEPHRRTLMGFPDIDSISNQDERSLRGCRQEVANIANAIAKFEPVWLHARPPHASIAREMVSSNVTVKASPLDNLWVRDTAPVFVQGPDGRLAGVDFHFNYWGENAPTTSNLDRNLASHILDETGVQRIFAPLTAEGGGIEVDGKGTFMGTESSLINPNRNKGMSKQQIEDSLSATLGITKFLWFKGIGFHNGDVTDCHVDALARFGPNDIIILNRPSKWAPRHDPLYQVYLQAKAVLEGSTNAEGKPLRIIEIEEPPPQTTNAGDDVVMSYVNYLLVNNAIIVPKFGHDKTDLPAIETFKELFPDREVVPVFLHYLPREGGGIHCATQHWPELPYE